MVLNEFCKLLDVETSAFQRQLFPRVRRHGLCRRCGKKHFVVAADASIRAAFGADESSGGKCDSIRAVVELGPVAPTIDVVVTYNVQQFEERRRSRLGFGVMESHAAVTGRVGSSRWKVSTRFFKIVGPRSVTWSPISLPALQMTTLG